MRITSILINNYCNNNRHVELTNPVFMAHPDFTKLSERYDVTASSYFRRGQMYGSPSRDYVDVINVFNRVFENNNKKKKDMLIIGVGKSQEPFSYLATIKTSIKDKPLNKNVALYTIDMQSKPNNDSLFKNSFYDSPFAPEYSKNGFVYDSENYGINYNCHYRVNDEIYDLVRESYNNQKKSQWDCRVQDVISDYPDEKFDVIAANNVLPYITSKDEIVDTILHIKRCLKPNGYFITDTTKFYYMDEPYLLDGLKEIHKGIYQKING